MWVIDCPLWQPWVIFTHLLLVGAEHDRWWLSFPSLRSNLLPLRREELAAEIKSGSGWSIEAALGQEQICIRSTDEAVRRRRRWGTTYNRFAKSWPRPLPCSAFSPRQVRKEYFTHGCQFSLDISLLLLGIIKDLFKRSRCSISTSSCDQRTKDLLDQKHSSKII